MLTYRVHEKTFNMEINSPRESSRSDLAQKEKRIGVKNRWGGTTTKERNDMK